MEDKFGFNAKIAALKAAKVDLPRDLAVSGERFFQQEFQKAEWNGVKWQPRVRETKKTKGKHLLVATGRLKQAMQNTIISVDWTAIKWGVDRNIEYAAYLNFGTDKMVQREFLGYSPKLVELLKKKIDFRLSEVLHKK